jgi:hypothetical protein
MCDPRFVCIPILWSATRYNILESPRTKPESIAPHRRCFHSKRRSRFNLHEKLKNRPKAAKKGSTPRRLSARKKGAQPHHGASARRPPRRYYELSRRPYTDRCVRVRVLNVHFFDTRQHFWRFDQSSHTEDVQRVNSNRRLEPSDVRLESVISPSKDRIQFLFFFS